VAPSGEYESLFQMTLGSSSFLSFNCRPTMMSLSPFATLVIFPVL